MPTISEFFGIVIRMYYDEHNPPHFHAYYADHEAMISIESLTVLKGALPKRAKALVVEWATEHREALFDDWRLASAHKTLNRIDPLE
ncbi:MAG: DUF4160 domain-containing protein [Burkholderiaceae bacterium]|nr:DUF4160 domain-containing protein [Burkholderiaceae bacterium]